MGITFQLHYDSMVVIPREIRSFFGLESTTQSLLPRRSLPSLTIYPLICCDTPPNAMCCCFDVLFGLLGAQANNANSESNSQIYNNYGEFDGSYLPGTYEVQQPRPVYMNVQAHSNNIAGRLRDFDTALAMTTTIR